MDLSKIPNLLYRYLWLLVLAALIASLVTFLQLGRQPAVYRATTDLLVGPGLDSPSPDLNALRIGGQLTQTYAEVVGNDTFLASVNNKLGQRMDPNDLKNAISSKQSADTRILTITVYYSDPAQAAAIANAAAQTLLEMSPSQDNVTASLRARMSEQSHQLEQIVSESQTKIQQLEEQLAALQAVHPFDPEAAKFNLDQQNLVVTELADERSRLSDALRTSATVYQILLGTDTNQIKIIQPATTGRLVDPQLWLRVGSSALGGLIFALIIVFAAEYFDDRLRFPKDFSRAAGAPLLSAIDKYRPSTGLGLERLVTLAQPGSDAANQYREAAARLILSIGNTIPSALLVSSVGSASGADAAVTTGNLAVAFAQAGYRVVLVDAQVENPVLTPLFEAEKKEWLAELATGRSTEPQLLPLVEQIPGIWFLPAGLSSENSAHGMLNPTKVAALYERLKREADIILVAGSALSRFAETLTLASQADSVILVACHAEAKAKEVSKVVESLRLMKIPLTGVIYDHNPSPYASKGGRGDAFALSRPSPEALPGSLPEHTTESRVSG